MGCIQSDPKAFGFIDAVEDRCEVGDFVTETTPLPRCVFKRDSHRGFFRRRQDLVQPRDSLIDTNFFAWAKVCARMEHEKREVELAGEFDLLVEGTDRDLSVFRGWRA